MRSARVARQPTTSFPPVVPTREELLHERKFLLGKEVPVKGFGVFARRDIPPWSPLCVYPGHVYSVNLKLDPKDPRVYAVDHFRVMGDGALRRDVVLDPAPLARGEGSKLDDLFAGCMAPRLNEPSAGEVPNVVWVNDVAAQRVYLYSFDKPIRMGEELLITYGPKYGPYRGWSESDACTGVTRTRILFDGPTLHAVTPSLRYLVLHAGMTTQFKGDPYEYPLDRVHPEGWYALNDALQAFVRKTRRRGAEAKEALLRPAKRFRDSAGADGEESDAEESDGYIEIVDRVLDYAPLPPRPAQTTAAMSE